MYWLPGYWTNGGDIDLLREQRPGDQRDRAYEQAGDDGFDHGERRRQHGIAGQLPAEDRAAAAGHPRQYAGLRRARPVQPGDDRDEQCPGEQRRVEGDDQLDESAERTVVRGETNDIAVGASGTVLETDVQVETVKRSGPEVV
ncbi:hypothetical protein [Halostella salina]|uniref:hypothetical protein n=1 Tax=Halostella salina TaxID=1547897 RepID=UPI0013CF2117|nr:hypothetical protein [Halostella salina]